MSGTPHDSTPTASFDARLVDLLWPQPPLTCSSHHDSTPGPLIPVVAACVKDARPSRWLAPLERLRWPQHRPRVAPPADPSLSAVAGGPEASGPVDLYRREAAGACAAPSALGCHLGGMILEWNVIDSNRYPGWAGPRLASPALHRAPEKKNFTLRWARDWRALALTSNHT